MTDYTLSFAAGSPVNSMLCVDIVILEDSAVEDIERFYVELSTSDPVNVLSSDNATVSILDNDGIGVSTILSVEKPVLIVVDAPMQCGAHMYNCIIIIC